jgi:hypothetical protein
VRATCRFSGLCKDLHKPDYAQSPIMLSPGRQGTALAIFPRHIAPSVV